MSGEQNLFPIVLSAPSGAGKTTIAKMLLDRRDDVGYSVSCTTRKPRAGERDGVDYHFLTREQFDTAVSKGEFAEWAEVHGNRYGTLKREVQRVIDAGKHVMLDIDVQGARQVVERIPEALTIFVIPPSKATLLSRLTGRNTESADALSLRIKNARLELADAERYQHVVVNSDLEAAVREVSGIIDEAERSPRRRPALGVNVGKDVQRLLRELESTA